jgi:predicted ATPase with chaperone activity
MTPPGIHTYTEIEEAHMASKHKEIERNTVEELRKWMSSKKISTTKDIKVPKRMMDQVIGQKEGVEVAKKAAEQRRHLLLIGDPGTDSKLNDGVSSP